MGQITLRELEKMDFFKEIPKDILQNLLNESKVVSYKGTRNQRTTALSVWRLRAFFIPKKPMPAKQSLKPASR